MADRYKKTAMMYVELGKIVGVWGVKGWVKLHSYTRHRAEIANYSTWYLQGGKSKETVAYDVLNCRQQGQGIVAQLEGIDSREQAMLLSGQRILVKESDLPELPKGEFYWQQLIGLQVSNLQGIEIGKISSILETGANDVLVIKSDTAGEEDTLIPYTDVVLEIDLERGSMLVDWDPDFLKN